MCFVRKSRTSMSPTRASQSSRSAPLTRLGRDGLPEVLELEVPPVFLLVEGGAAPEAHGPKGLAQPVGHDQVDFRCRP